METNKKSLEEIVEKEAEVYKNSWKKKFSDVEDLIYEILIVDYPKNNKRLGRHFFTSIFGSFFSLSNNPYLQIISFPLSYFSYKFGKENMSNLGKYKKYLGFLIGSFVGASVLYSTAKILQSEPINYYDLFRFNMTFLNLSSFITNYFYSTKKEKGR